MPTGRSDELSMQEAGTRHTGGVKERTPRVSHAAWLLGIALLVWIGAFVALRAYVAEPGRALRWDAGWYLSIATQDYRFDGDITHQQSVAFLPGYPFLLRLLLLVGLPMQVTVLLACIACSIVGALLLFRALSASLGPVTSAYACALALASPFSLYFLNGYSESAYFLATAAFWWALLYRRDDGLAALFAGLAGI